MQTREKQLKFAKLLINLKIDEQEQKQGTSIIADEDCNETLLSSIATCAALFEETYAFAALVSDSKVTIQEYYFSLLPIVKRLFLDFLLVTRSLDKPGHYDVYFDNDTAYESWLKHLENLKPPKSLEKVHDQPSNYGVTKRTLNLLREQFHGLKKYHWLNEVDINLALEALGIKDQVFVSSFHESTISAHLQQKKRSYSTDNQYTVYFILSAGGSEISQGKHWIRVKVSIHPETDVIYVTLRDSFGRPKTKLQDPGKEIQTLLRNAVKQVYPNFKKISVRCLGPEELQQSKDNDWICGYLALLATTREILIAPQESKWDGGETKATPQNSLNERFCNWKEGHTSDLRNLVFRLILNRANINEKDYIAFANDPPLQEIAFEISKAESTKPIIKLTEHAIDAVLNAVEYDFPARNVLVRRGLITEIPGKSPIRSLTILDSLRSHGLVDSRGERLDIIDEIRISLKSTPTETLDRRQFLICNRR